MQKKQARLYTSEEVKSITANQKELKAFKEELEKKSKEEVIEVAIKWKSNCVANYEAYQELRRKFEKLATAYCYISEIEAI
jgi:hypothetical protein